MAVIGMEKIYKNPPIIEAICEFRFEPAGLATQGQIASFHESIMGFFPVAGKGKVHNIQFQIEPPKAEGKPNQSVKGEFHEFDQYFSKDGKCSVQLDSGRVSIHSIKPYVPWKDFHPMIQKVCSSYIHAFSPKSLQRIGIRYINEINVPIPDFSFEDYFNIRVSVPPFRTNDARSLFIGSIFEQEMGRDAVKIQFAEKQMPGIHSNRIFLLDSDYFLLTPTTTFETIDKWMDNAHAKLGGIFESILTDKAKDLFNE